MWPCSTEQRETGARTRCANPASLSNMFLWRMRAAAPPNISMSIYRSNGGVKRAGQREESASKSWWMEGAH